jgi:hypothetical protein
MICSKITVRLAAKDGAVSSYSTLIEAAWSGSKPRFTSSTLIKLRISSLAFTSRTHARATSDTTKAVRTHSCLRPRPAPAPESFSPA